jgi:armadillo repeat-containing protein 4
MRECGGLAPLVEILYSSEMPDDLLLALTGAVWKLSLSPANVESLQKLGIIPILVNLLHDRPEKVYVYLTTFT